MLATGLLSLVSAAHASDASLVNEVLALDQQTHALEIEQQPGGSSGGTSGDTSGFAVLIGSGRNELRLRKLNLRIDDLPAVQYEYAQAEWEAIAAGGLHPAWTGPLTQGEHRLRLELYSRELDAGPTDARVVERLDRKISVAPGKVIEIGLTQQRFGSSGLEVIEWRNDAAPVAVDNQIPRQHPWLRAGAYWLNSGRAYAAARMFRRQQLLSPGAFWASDANALMGTSLQQLSQQSGAPRADATAVAGIERLNLMLQGVTAGDAQALITLEEMGTADAEGETGWTLRDRANLLLGYEYLRRGASETALEALGRVRSTGPHGNEALLGFGWAFLVPPVDQAQAVTVSRSAEPFQRPAFITAIEAATTLPYKDRKTALERALVPWTELIGRDFLDPAAQEGSLALAWALDQLDASTQSHKYYGRTAEQFEGARKRLDAAMQHVSGGALAEAIASGQNDATTGWRLWLAELPYADETEYLKYLLTDMRFVDAVDQYRQERLLRDELDACAKRLAALPSDDSRVVSLLARADVAHIPAAASERFAREHMNGLALELLRAHKRRTENYLATARFALARHLDNAQAPEIELKREPRNGEAS